MRARERERSSNTWDSDQNNVIGFERNHGIIMCSRSVFFLSFGIGRFQQEAHTSNFQDQRKANRAISLHEGLAIGTIAI